MIGVAGKAIAGRAGGALSHRDRSGAATAAVGRAGRQTQSARAGDRNGGRMSGPVIGEAAAGDRGRRGGRGDRDRRIAAGRVVVGISIKGPVRGSAGHVGKRGAPMQQARQVGRRWGLHTGGRAGGAMRGAIVAARIAGDADDGIGFSDRDALGIARGVVIGVAAKAGRGRASIGGADVGAVAAVDHRQGLIQPARSGHCCRRREGRSPIRVGSRLPRHHRRRRRLVYRLPATERAGAAAEVAGVRRVDSLDGMGRSRHRQCGRCVAVGRAAGERFRRAEVDAINFELHRTCGGRGTRDLGDSRREGHRLSVDRWVLRGSHRNRGIDLVHR